MTVSEAIGALTYEAFDIELYSRCPQRPGGLAASLESDHNSVLDAVLWPKCDLDTCVATRSLPLMRRILYFSS